MTNLDSVLKSRHHFADKGPYSQGYGLSSSHIQIWELDHKEGRASKNWCFRTVVLEKTLESPLDSKEIKPVNLKGNQPWILFGRTDAEAKAPILWPPDVKSQLTGKDPDAGKGWKQKEKMASEDEVVGWHHRFKGHELGQSPGRWWERGKPGALQSMRPQRIRQDSATEQLFLLANLQQVFFPSQFLWQYNIDTCYYLCISFITFCTCPRRYLSERKHFSSVQTLLSQVFTLSNFYIIHTYEREHTHTSLYFHFSSYKNTRRKIWKLNLLSNIAF